MFDRIVLSCEHARNRIPARYAHLFDTDAATLEGHRGYDLGALEVARFLLDNETGDPVQALEQAKAAAHQDRGSALAHSLMSDAWAAQQEWAEAYVHAQAAVTLHPRSRQARARLKRLEEHLDAGRR